MKKILLLLALTFMVGAVNAKTDKFACNVTFPTDKSANCDYNTTTKVFSWSASNSNSMRIFNSLKGNVDLSKYKWLIVKVSELTSNYRIHIFCDNNTSTTSYNETFTGNVRIDLTSITLTTSGHTYANINRISIAGSGNTSSGSLKIEEADVYLETAEYETMEISTTLDNDATSSSPFQWYTSTDGTSKTESTGDFYKKQFNTADIKEIIAKAGSSLGWSNGFFDITGYDNATVNISTYKEGNDSDVRLLRATGANSTENIYISANKKGATTTSLSGLTSYWICGIYSRNAIKSQAISSVVFTKQYKAYKAVGAPAFEIAASSGSTVAYDRTFPTDKKSTVCLPFALTEAEVTAAGTFYELTSAADGTLTFSEVSETEAYKPYVFEANTANPFASLTNKVIVASEGQACQTTVGDYTFQGTLAHQSLPSGVYGYNAANGVFSVTTSDAITIDAFRGYIRSGKLAREIRCVFGNEITGINEVKSQKAEENDILYSPSGQRVSADYKGIVIKNGRKYFKE